LAMTYGQGGILVGAMTPRFVDENMPWHAAN